MKRVLGVFLGLIALIIVGIVGVFAFSGTGSGPASDLANDAKAAAANGHRRDRPQGQGQERPRGQQSEHRRGDRPQRKPGRSSHRAARHRRMASRLAALHRHGHRHHRRQRPRRQRHRHHLRRSRLRLRRGLRPDGHARRPRKRAGLPPLPRLRAVASAAKASDAKVERLAARREFRFAHVSRDRSAAKSDFWQRLHVSNAARRRPIAKPSRKRLVA